MQIIKKKKIRLKCTIKSNYETFTFNDINSLFVYASCNSFKMLQTIFFHQLFYQERFWSWCSFFIYINMIFFCLFWNTIDGAHWHEWYAQRNYRTFIFKMKILKARGTFRYRDTKLVYNVSRIKALMLGSVSFW